MDTTVTYTYSHTYTTSLPWRFTHSSKMHSFPLLIFLLTLPFQQIFTTASTTHDPADSVITKSNGRCANLSLMLLLYVGWNTQHIWHAWASSSSSSASPSPSVYAYVCINAIFMRKTHVCVHFMHVCIMPIICKSSST